MLRADFENDLRTIAEIEAMAPDLTRSAREAEIEGDTTSHPAKPSSGKGRDEHARRSDRELFAPFEGPIAHSNRYGERFALGASKPSPIPHDFAIDR